MDGMPRAAVLSAAATERLLLTERLLALVPRNRGFRVDADGTINVYAGIRGGSDYSRALSLRNQPLENQRWKCARFLS